MRIASLTSPLPTLDCFKKKELGKLIIGLPCCLWGHSKCQPEIWVLNSPYPPHEICLLFSSLKVTKWSNRLVSTTWDPEGLFWDIVISSLDLCKSLRFQILKWSMFSCFKLLISVLLIICDVVYNYFVRLLCAGLLCSNKWVCMFLTYRDHSWCRVLLPETLSRLQHTQMATITLLWQQLEKSSLGVVEMVGDSAMGILCMCHSILWYCVSFIVIDP